MKQSLTLQEYYDAPVPVIILVEHWKKQKGYIEPTVSIGIIWEILKSCSEHMRKDDILHGVKQYVLDAPDVVLAWESPEPIYDMWYELQQAIKKLLATRSILQAHTPE